LKSKIASRADLIVCLRYLHQKKLIIKNAIVSIKEVKLNCLSNWAFR